MVEKVLATLVRKLSLNFSLALSSVLLILALIIATFSFPYLIRKPNPILDLSTNHWIAGYGLLKAPEHNSFRIEVPSDVTIQKDPKFRGDITYFTEFDTPAECISGIKACTLFISEVGDAASLSINNIEIGNHGSLPPNGRYAKNYPLSILIPNSILIKVGPNHLALKVHSFKYVQSGIRKGPVGIFRESDAHLLNISQITQTIVSPIISGIILFVLAICSIVVLGLSQNDNENTIRRFTYFCAVTALFLFSFSELPREILPISLAGYLHYFLRILSDYTLFILVAGLFYKSPPIFKVFKICYWAALSSFFCVYVSLSLTHRFEFSGFDDAYVITRLAAPLVLLPHLLGIIGGFRSKTGLSRLLIVLLFLTTLLFQLNDTLIFHAVIKGQYLVKFYPTLQAFCLGGYVFYAKFAEWIVVRSNTIARIDLSRQLAHDIRSPLAALEMISGSIDDLTEDKRIIVKSAIHRIRDIANSLLPKKHCESSFCSPDDQASETVGYPTESEIKLAILLSPVIEAMVTEKRAQYQELSKVHICYDNSKSAYGLFAEVQNNEFKRVLSNLIDNAVEALPSQEGTVDVSLEYSLVSRDLRIAIKDSGVGISSEIIPTLGSKGNSIGKVRGSGLGLFHAFEKVRSWGGCIRIDSQIGYGTTVSVHLNRSATPRWFVEQINISKQTKIIALDDDTSIHQIWDKRFQSLRDKSASKPLEHFFRTGDLSRYYRENFVDLEDVLFLVDYEILGESETGLDLIEKLGIQTQSILITSHYEAKNIRERCEKQKVSLIPKSMSGFVPIYLA